MSVYLNNERILAGVLADHGVKHVVFTAGAGHTALKKELERSGGYSLYSAIDERNASYYALGLTLEADAPAAVVCPAQTAGNYLPAMAEAFYQNLPMLFIAVCPHDGADRSMTKTYEIVSMESGFVPAVRGEQDEQSSVVAINSLLRRLTLFGKGPVFMMIEEGGEYAGDKKGAFIDCLKLCGQESAWQERAQRLFAAKRTALIVDEGAAFTAEKAEAFAGKFGCAVLSTPTAAVQVNGAAELEAAAEGRMELPELVITVGEENNDHLAALRRALAGTGCSHWHVAPSGEYRDVLGRLDTVFAVTADEFFDTMNVAVEGEKSARYGVKAAAPKAKAAEGAQAVMLALAGVVENGVVQDSFGMDAAGLRAWKKGVRLYSTVESGTSIGGISMFLGTAFHLEEPCYLMIDDIGFYNDMNALMLRGIRENIHILLMNTGRAGAAGYLGAGDQPGKAEHLLDWAASTGFDVIRAASAKEAAAKMKAFAAHKGVLPVILAVDLKAEA